MSGSAAGRRRARGRRGAALAAAFLLLQGCLEWEEQEIRIVHDRDADQVEIQLVYRGLYSAEKEESPAPPPVGRAPSEVPEEGAHRRNVEDSAVAATIETLTELLAGRQRFALQEPLFSFDLEELRERPDRRVAAIAAAVAVDHGEFFRDERGRWCAWQQVRIESVSRLVPLASELLREALLRSATRGKQDDVLQHLWLRDTGSRKKQEPALGAPFCWLALRDGVLALRVPASESGVRELQRRLEAARDWNERVDELREIKRAAQRGSERGLESGRERGAEDGGRVVGVTAGGDADAPDDAPQAVREAMPALPTDDEDGLWTSLARAAGVVAVPTRFGVELRFELPSAPGTALRLRPMWIRPDRAADLSPHLAATRAPIRAAVDADFLAREFAWFRSR
jgi:hypothetical protein